MPDLMLQGLDLFADRIQTELAQVLQCPADQIVLDRPRGEGHGEFALPCFRFAKAAKKNPAELAEELAGSLCIADITASAVGPFLNFKICPISLAQRVTEDAGKNTWGKRSLGRKTLVEYSSPNIAKPMHVGHLRSTVIGAALARLHEHLGDEVVRINHIGDWGSQFGKLVAGWRRWGEESEFEKDPIGHLLALYVRYHEEEKEDKTLPADAKSAFQELESGEENDTRTLWTRFTAFSLREFDKVYQRLDAKFDLVRGESWYEDKLTDVVDWLKDCQVLKEDDGAQIVDLSSEGIKTPCLVLTSHGTTLYATRDLAAARSRWNEFTFDRCLYVVGAEQTLHFNQFKAVLKRCNADWWNRIEHIPFGLIRFAEGKLSTREGRVLRLEEVLDRAVELAADVIQEKNPDLKNKEAVAEQVGVGAIIFHDLKHQRQKDVLFNWKEVLSFEGDTGPYLQYTHARCCSILRKSENGPPKEFDAQLLANANPLLVALGRFPDAILDASKKREPTILAQALLKIAAAGNSFYREHRVLGTGDEKLEAARLSVIDSLRNTLRIGLGILGVPAPEEM